jgi:hypothetical protein
MLHVFWLSLNIYCPVKSCFFCGKKSENRPGSEKFFRAPRCLLRKKTPGFDVNKREVIGKKWEDCFPRVPQIYPADSVAK